MTQLILPGDAGFGDVLAGKHFSAGTNYNTAGAMPNNGAITITPSGSTQAIPAGYHNGSGQVSAVVVPVANVLTGTTIAGVAGTMPNNGAVTLTPSGTGTVAIPAGYHNGSGVVSQVSVPAANVLVGTTIASVAGTMPNQGSPTFTPSPSAQSVPAGYYSGGTISAGTQYASGSTTTDGSGNISVSGLTFTPKTVIIARAGYYSVAYFSSNLGSSGQFYNYSTGASMSYSATSGGFSCNAMTAFGALTSVNWHAYGD